MIRSLVDDLRSAARTLGAAPGFALTTVLTLALGVAAVASTFAVLQAVVLQPLVYPEADRLVDIRHATTRAGGSAQTGVSTGTYLHYRARARSLDAVALYQRTTVSVSGSEEPAERVDALYANPELFDVLGITPLVGRAFLEADGAPGFLDTRWPVPVVLGHDLWQRRYGGDPGIVDQLVQLGDSPRRVVGVLPPRVTFPASSTQIWILSMPDERIADVARNLSYGAVARLSAGATPPSAAAELSRLLDSIEGLYPDATPERLADVQLVPLVSPLKNAMIGDAGQLLWTLVAGMAVLLLVCCANAGNLFLVRSIQRTREVLVRSALGARRVDLIRPLVGEILWVSTGVLVVAWVLAGSMTSALLVLAPLELPRLDEVRVDGRVFAFTCGVAVLATMLSGLIGIWGQLRAAAGSALRGGMEAAGGGRYRLAQNALVAGQSALALVLVVSAGLLAQTFWRLTQVDLGFVTRNALTVEIALPGSRAGLHQTVYQRLLTAVAALPGVSGVAAASSLPLEPAGHLHPVRVVGREPASPEVPPRVALTFFTPGYFEAMGIPVIAGDGLSRHSTAGGDNPVVISAALARRWFRDGNALGAQLERLEADGTTVTMFDFATRTRMSIPPYTIAGVVGDVRHESLRRAPAEIVYLPVVDPPVERSIVPIHMTLVVRSELAPLSLAHDVRGLVHDVDPSITVARVRTLESMADASLARERMLAALLAIVAAASLFLGAVGIHGIVACTLRRRTGEIGVRMAVGARPADVYLLMMRDRLLVVLAGASAGLLIVATGTGRLESWLFGVHATDPATLVAAVALLFATTIAATLGPARRAARLNPSTILRHDEG